FNLGSIMSTVEAPLDLVETLARKTDKYLQSLMDRNTEGLLTGAEREELEALVELSEQMAILRSEALRLLQRKPNERLMGRGTWSSHPRGRTYHRPRCRGCR